MADALVECPGHKHFEHLDKHEESGCHDESRHMHNAGQYSADTLIVGSGRPAAKRCVATKGASIVPTPACPASARSASAKRSAEAATARRPAAARKSASAAQTHVLQTRAATALAGARNPPFRGARHPDLARRAMAAGDAQWSPGLVVDSRRRVVLLPCPGLSVSRSLYASRDRGRATDADSGDPARSAGCRSTPSARAILVLLRISPRVLPLCAELPGSVAASSRAICDTGSFAMSGLFKISSGR